jgi:hypothetical protein
VKGYTKTKESLWRIGENWRNNMAIQGRILFWLLCLAFTISDLSPLYSSAENKDSPTARKGSPPRPEGKDAATEGQTIILDADTACYQSGPQQGFPPLILPKGTKVKILPNAKPIGGYERVRTEGGQECYM